MQNDVAIFQEAVGQTISTEPAFTPQNSEQATLYFNLVREEFRELHRAFEQEDIVGTADGAADLVWVILGLCNTLGIHFAPVWNEVARSNMSKIPIDGVLTKREDGKILKPNTFSPADIKTALGLSATRND